MDEAARRESPIIDSRAGFAAAVLWSLEAAMAEGTRRIVCVDPDFGHWPLDEPRWIDGLTAWLRWPQRRLTLLANDYRQVPRRCPRFTAWRRDWVHAIDCWQPPAQPPVELPSVLYGDASVVLQLTDAVHWRGRAAVDARRARQWRDELDALLQRCEPAFATVTLGL